MASCDCCSISSAKSSCGPFTLLLCRYPVAWHSALNQCVNSCKILEVEVTDPLKRTFLFSSTWNKNCVEFRLQFCVADIESRPRCEWILRESLLHLDYLAGRDWPACNSHQCRPRDSCLLHTPMNRGIHCRRRSPPPLVHNGSRWCSSCRLYCMQLK